MIISNVRARECLIPAISVASDAGILLPVGLPAGFFIQWMSTMTRDDPSDEQVLAAVRLLVAKARQAQRQQSDEHPNEQSDDEDFYVEVDTASGKVCVNIRRCVR